MNGIECDEVTCTPISKITEKECPWMVGTSGLNNTFECGDGSTCNAQTGLLVDTEDIGTYEWDCCNNLQKRSKCPNNFPYMCNDPCPSCLTGVNFTCHALSCNAHGGYRTCEKAEKKAKKRAAKMMKMAARAKKMAARAKKRAARAKKRAAKAAKRAANRAAKAAKRAAKWAAKRASPGPASPGPASPGPASPGPASPGP